MVNDDLPYSGVKVLDLSQGAAGPYCSMHLARNGADAIKVEPTGSGCWSRQPDPVDGRSDSTSWDVCSRLRSHVPE